MLKPARVILATLLLALGAAFAQTNISIALYPDLDSHLNAVLEQFHAENPDIIVEVRILDHGDHHTALVTNLATGSGAADKLKLGPNVPQPGVRV